jgi:hypothetical protein
MAEVTVKPYRPNLVPVDYDPWGDIVTPTPVVDQQPAFQPQAKLIAKTLFDIAPTVLKPTIAAVTNPAFAEGFNKSGQAGLKSMGEALENQYVPEGAVKYDDAGDYYDKDGKKLDTQYRPNLVPVTKTEPGKGWFGTDYEGATPALADVWNTLGGAGGKATLGAGPSLRPALKYGDKVYKAKAGEQHLDAIPKELQDTFQKQALSGEDISNFNFGFINHKGHFLQREDALKYAIDHGILDPNDAKYGALVTTMLNKSGGEGKIASTFFSALEDAVSKVNQNKASGDQWLGTLSNAKGVKGEEIEHTGLKEFLAGKKNVTKAEIEDYLKQNQVNINDVWKGGGQKHKFGTPEEQAVATARYENAHRALGQAKIDTPEYQSALNEFNQAQAAMPDIVPGWGRAQGNGEFMKGGDTKYSQWQLPGGENYRELLMTLPSSKPEDVLAQKMFGKNYHDITSLAERGQIVRQLPEGHDFNQATYKSGHWDEPNILAHMRMNDRTIDGKKSLHLEEIQSDWHQQGREKGYKGDLSNLEKAGLEASRKKLEAKEHLEKLTEGGLASAKELDDAMKAVKLADEEFKKASDAYNNIHENGVPDAPFKKTWHELALKRAIREAAENGYERLSWTPGEAQAARYDLSKQVQDIGWNKSLAGPDTIVRINPNDGKTIALQMNKDGKIVESNPRSQAAQFEGKHLSDIVGKDLAKEIIGKESGELKGDGLKIGGEGMKGFYDNIIPKSVEKIAKEFGVKVQKGGEKAKVTDFVYTDKSKPNYGQEYWVGVGNDGKYLTERFKTKAEAQKYVDENNIYKNPLFYIDIPPAMRQSVMQKGQPLFSGTPTLVPVDYNPFENEK